MSVGDFRSCLGCRSHQRVGKALHLCTLPPECAPPLPEGIEAPDDGDTEGREYLGTSCDRMRAMGALCGPHAALWEAKA